MNAKYQGGKKNLQTGLSCMYSKALLSAGLATNLEWLQFYRPGQSKTQQKSVVLLQRIQLGTCLGGTTVRGW